MQPIFIKNFWLIKLKKPFLEECHQKKLKIKWILSDTKIANQIKTDLNGQEFIIIAKDNQGFFYILYRQNKYWLIKRKPPCYEDYL